MSFKKRQIDVTFQLGEGDFGEAGFDVVKLSGLRCQVDIALAGGIQKGALNLRVYGMTLDMMNKLAKVGRLAPSTKQNIVTVEARSDDDIPVSVFTGSIFTAWADFQGAPDVCLNVDAASGWFESNKPVDALTYKSGVKVSLVIADIAAKMGYGFVDHGVNAVLPPSYMPGTAWDQLLQATQMADINFSLHLGVIHIWEKGKYRLQDLALISAETGMVGYPRFCETGITLTTEYDPAIVSGGLVNVQSQLVPACGAWVVNQLSHNLTSETPGGPWFTNIECSRYDQPTIKSN